MGTNRFTLIRKDFNGFDYDCYATVYEMPFEVEKEDTEKCLSLFKEISLNFIDTKEGQEIFESNDGCFGWNDFANIPDSFLERYGVLEVPVDTGIAEIKNMDDPIFKETLDLKG